MRVDERHADLKEQRGKCKFGKLKELHGQTKEVLGDETGDRDEGGSLLQNYTGRQIS